MDQGTQLLTERGSFQHGTRCDFVLAIANWLNQFRVSEEPKQLCFVSLQSELLDPQESLESYHDRLRAIGSAAKILELGVDTEPIIANLMSAARINRRAQMFEPKVAPPGPPPGNAPDKHFVPDPPHARPDSQSTPEMVKFFEFLASY